MSVRKERERVRSHFDQKKNQIDLPSFLFLRSWTEKRRRRRRKNIFISSIFLLLTQSSFSSVEPETTDSTDSSVVRYRRWGNEWMFILFRPSSIFLLRRRVREPLAGSGRKKSKLRGERKRDREKTTRSNSLRFATRFVLLVQVLSFFLFFFVRTQKLLSG